MERKISNIDINKENIRMAYKYKLVEIKENTYIFVTKKEFIEFIENVDNKANQSSIKAALVFLTFLMPGLNWEMPSIELNSNGNVDFQWTNKDEDEEGTINMTFRDGKAIWGAYVVAYTIGIPVTRSSWGDFKIDLGKI